MLLLDLKANIRQVLPNNLSLTSPTMYFLVKIAVLGCNIKKYYNNIPTIFNLYFEGAEKKIDWNYRI